MNVLLDLRTTPPELGCPSAFYEPGLEVYPGSWGLSLTVHFPSTFSLPSPPDKNLSQTSCI